MRCLPWPALTHHSPAVPSNTLQPSASSKYMPLADASIRGAALNCLLAVNGIQKLSRLCSFEPHDVIVMLSPNLHASFSRKLVSDGPQPRARHISIPQSSANASAVHRTEGRFPPEIQTKSKNQRIRLNHGCDRVAAPQLANTPYRSENVMTALRRSLCVRPAPGSTRHLTS